MGSRGITGSCVVIFVSTSAEVLLEGSGLSWLAMTATVTERWTNLIDGHAARVVLIIALGIDQFSGQGIFPSKSPL